MAITLNLIHKSLNAQAATSWDFDTKRNNSSIIIGRDSSSCHVHLKDLSVAKIHASIFFKADFNGYYIHNLQPLNPISIDGAVLIQGEARLWQGSTIQLGNSTLLVEKLKLSSNKAISSQTPNRNSLSTNSPARLITPSQLSSSPPTPQPTQEHGLQCPKCQTIHPLTSQNVSCHICGHFLADADSVLISPKH
ncbi:hypothetical protein XM38_003980 [Halomicronema hongdechloris C2206]|uniref:FHA domain-containing protein n=1 Tax=Halomicronema hongdechloris C2206 TaxID=1641165 RepID=A0A1Z3HGR2_9CYAN|nr:FHA domain-containing protein [Halomicronema hongdechloris]ASC69471.1 hypothetical protein XM38_003980 [Halomicronema hongdechloris C2206]